MNSAVFKNLRFQHKKKQRCGGDGIRIKKQKRFCIERKFFVDAKLPSPTLHRLRYPNQLKRPPFTKSKWIYIGGVLIIINRTI
jgi:hypothetical protein